MVGDKIADCNGYGPLTCLPISGDLIYMTALGRSVLLVNDTAAQHELFDKRAKNYTHRPNTVMAGELIGLSKVSS